MNLQEIVDATRYRLNNYEKPYFWIDSEMVFYANEVINEIAREAKVLKDSTTASVCEIFTTVNILDYSLAASIIRVNGVKLVTKELLTLDVAPSTIWAAGDTITGASSTKTCYVEEALTTTTYVISQRTGAFTLGEILSNGTNTADQGSSYPTTSDYESSNLIMTRRTEMDMGHSGWRYSTADKPYKYLLDFQTGYITLYPRPDDEYLIRLSVIRYPITAMSATSMSTQTPEIDSKYHEVIVNGICARAHLKRGDDTYDPKRAAEFMGLYRKGISDMKINEVMSKDPEIIFEPRGAFI